MAKYYLTKRNDTAEAVYWFKKAAAQKDVASQLFMAAVYKYGYGVKQSPDKARKYYIAGAKNGSHHASNVETQ